MYGHAGMLGAAAAVWEDLRSSHLLAALLDLPADEDCKPFHQDKGDHKYDPRMSHSERDRHMEWECGDSSVGYKSNSVGDASKDAASAARDRNKGPPRSGERRKWRWTTYAHDLSASIACCLTQYELHWIVCHPSALLPHSSVSKTVRHAFSENCAYAEASTATFWSRRQDGTLVLLCIAVVMLQMASEEVETLHRPHPRPASIQGHMAREQTTTPAGSLKGKGAVSQGMGANSVA